MYMYKYIYVCIPHPKPQIHIDRWSGRTRRWQRSSGRWGAWRKSWRRHTSAPHPLFTLNPAPCTLNPEP